MVKQTKTKNIFNQEEKFSGLKTKKQKLFFEIYLKIQNLNLYNFKNKGLFFFK